MPYTPDQLIKIATKYAEMAKDIIGTDELEVKAADKKEKKKVDPKAKVRNRGTVCVPAESAKDKKDHFPINDEGQARNALARVHQYSSVPAWYSGSLKGLQDAVSRKVHSKYPSIGKSDKKKKSSSLESYIEKFAEEYVYKTAQRQPISQVRNPGMPNEENMMPSGVQGPYAPGTAPKPPQVGVPDAVDKGQFPYISDAFQRQLLQAGKITRQQYDSAKAAHTSKTAPQANWTPISAEVQKRLNKMGYKGRNGQPLEPDGKLGQETRHALNVFKMKSGNPKMSDAEAINVLNLGQVGDCHNNKQYPMTNAPGNQPKTHKPSEHVDPWTDQPWNSPEYK